jgi:hypothetical protein
MSLPREHEGDHAAVEGVVNWLCIRPGEAATIDDITMTVMTIPGQREVQGSGMQMILGGRPIARAGDAAAAGGAEAGTTAGTTGDGQQSYCQTLF